MIEELRRVQGAGDSCEKGDVEANRMPVYVYQCQVCGGEQEVLQGIRDEPKRGLHCAKCGRSTSVVRLTAAISRGPTGDSRPPSS